MDSDVGAGISASATVDRLESFATSDVTKSNASSKFLSIDDILVRGSVSSKTDINLNLASSNAQTIEPRVIDEAIHSSEDDNLEKKLNFEQRVTARLYELNAFSHHTEPSAMFEPVSRVEAQPTFTSRTDMMVHATNNLLEDKSCGHGSELYTQNAADGESPADFWDHPLWKQFYEAKISQNSQPGLTKILLPSYLGMPQHILGTRLRFCSSSAESDSENRTVDIVFNVGHGDEHPGKHHMDKRTGHDGQSPVSICDDATLPTNAGKRPVIIVHNESL